MLTNLSRRNRRGLSATSVAQASVDKPGSADAVTVNILRGSTEGDDFVRKLFASKPERNEF